MPIVLQADYFIFVSSGPAEFFNVFHAKRCTKLSAAESVGAGGYGVDDIA